MPGSSLVSKYTKGELPMYFLRDMGIVPDAAYVANLCVNSASMADYVHYKNPTVDELINKALTSTDEPQREADMQRVQHLVVDEAPWIFLFNPGYQLATRTDVKGYSWYTPNGNAWYDFYKQ
jgi:peptide/nickel transport system substrate-binding protein